jgi:phenylpropionate dioxygenase-like ring-hydroxylating dioxygenase large terminal subunit
VNGLTQLGQLVDLDAGLVSARVFADPDLYQLEQERVFGRAWLFVAHESEIPRPGDFVTRSMGEDPVIVVRGADGKVRVLLNVCRHRGRKVCALDAGRAATFRCGYHGWTYDSTGALTSVPFFEAYQGRLDKSTLGLYPAAAVDSYHGLIFATWDPDAESLRAYLGPLTWVLDMTFGRTEAVEVVAPPVRWQAATNWKLGAANFTGDGMHVFVTHGFSTQLGLHALQATGGPPSGYALSTENAHGASLVATNDAPPYFGLPESMWPEIESHLSREQAEIMRPCVVIAANVFPKLSILETSGHTPEEWGAPDDRPISFLTLRQWQPRGPELMEALSWLLLDRSAPEEWKARSKACYQRVFGVAGTFEQDDLANWAAITEGLHGPQAQDMALQFPLGLGIQPSPDWPGPGTAYFGRPPFFDHNERQFYAHWQRLLMRE